MKQELSNIISHKLKHLIPQLENDEFRESYINVQTRILLANQIRALRGDKSQEEYSHIINKPQSVVSRLENPDAAKSIQSLEEIANAHKVALLVKFVDFSTYILETSVYGDDELAPPPYNKDDVSNALRMEMTKQTQTSISPTTPDCLIIVPAGSSPKTISSGRFNYAYRSIQRTNTTAVH